MIGIALAGLLAVADPPPQNMPTAEEMFISCYLFVRTTDVFEKDASYSSVNCGLMALATIANEYTYRKDSRIAFCLPDNAEFRNNPAQAMANAYLDFYPKRASTAGGADGKTAFVVSQHYKWPCPGATP